MNQPEKNKEDMDNNTIEINGKIIDLDNISDNELDKLEYYLLDEIKLLRKKIDEHLDINLENDNWLVCKYNNVDKNYHLYVECKGRLMMR